mmetsp:Transcript_24521/g.52239  ORF Transcript_24521/g.52239 Transcript_24521/m.52239 type:complete len:298 (+) Transcript_24521:229-1122(+)
MLRSRRVICKRGCKRRSRKTKGKMMWLKKKKCKTRHSTRINQQNHDGKPHPNPRQLPHLHLSWSFVMKLLQRKRNGKRKRKKKRKMKIGNSSSCSRSNSSRKSANPGDAKARPSGVANLDARLTMTTSTTPTKTMWTGCRTSRPPRTRRTKPLGSENRWRSHSPSQRRWPNGPRWLRRLPRRCLQPHFRLLKLEFRSSLFHHRSISRCCKSTSTSICSSSSSNSKPGNSKPGSNDRRRKVRPVSRASCFHRSSSYCAMKARTGEAGSSLPHHRPRPRQPVWKQWALSEPCWTEPRQS